jgi:tetratricopeptide (TPR) repeat protein
LIQFNIKCFGLLVLLLLFKPSFAQVDGDKAVPLEQVYRETFDLIFKDVSKARIKLDSIERIMSVDWPDTLQSKIFRAKGIYYNTQELYDSALLYMNRALKLLPDEHEALYLKTMVDIAMIYKYDQDYNNALLVLDRITDELDAGGDFLLRARVRGQMASIYARLQNFTLAITFQLECVEILKSNTTNELATAIETFNLAVLYQKMDNFKEAQSLFELSLPVIKKHQILSNYYKGLVNMTYIALELDDFKKADSLINYTVSNSPIKSESFLSALDGAKALYYERTMRYDRALQIYRDLYNRAKDNNNQYILNIAKSYINVLQKTEHTVDIYNVILDLESYLKAHETTNYGIMDKLSYYQLAMHYLDPASDALFAPYQNKVITLQDSLVALNKFTLKKQIEAENDRALEKAQRELLSVKVKQQRTTVFVVIGILMIALTVFILVIKYIDTKKRLKQARIEVVEKQNDLLHEEIKNQEAIAFIKDKELKNHKAEVMALTAERAKNINKFNQLLNDFDAPTQKAIREKLYTVTKEDNYWNLIKEKFLRVNPNFIIKIRDYIPNANNNLIDFCLLINLRLSNKEIAEILNISYQSVITKKSRLKKQLGLPDEADVTSVIESW